MTTSSKLTDESSHPSGLLAYDALPNHQDFDLMISDVKFTTDDRTDFYDHGLTGRRCALVGVACSSIFSCSCIVAGVVTLANYGVSGQIIINMITNDSPILLSLHAVILALTLNLIVTLCTESLGFIHGISLRSALASESRLRFNTNLRLLTAARGWYNPNGALLNGISAVLLMVSYSSASLVVWRSRPTMPLNNELSVSIAALPLLILGVALLLQVLIALSGMRAVKILTWSSSPFDLTAALVRHTQLIPAPFRCMRCVSDPDTYGGPAKPVETQPLRGMLTLASGKLSFLFGGSLQPSFPDALTPHTWSFLPNGFNSIVYLMPGANFVGWILLFVNIAVIQGPLTLGLHCSELIANVIRDERQWRCATGMKGLPFLHWMFGLAFNIHNNSQDEKLVLLVYMYTAQIWNLCIALFIFACFFTFVALRRPRGPQPAAYGHVQTLANLVDEWSPVMWWGHKEDGIPYCHAGTSDHPLPDVKMDRVYAGSGAGSPVPLS
ncbi:uncharacterized protein BJ212DRAFT_1485256 [Suillus subaureus]|uniref:Uncharacterized protein n=1 Tax=Suillus subaureus TaxID=48587 RepID=A0A9P7J835_9AGAM|nr:uncharacterized protein BJ212DRAFT_1485256 [Suillus subaureus]KAG1807979.1 hypothetical protein BJ212DRAFT_1485256 [Suillus subaureus]